MASMAIPGIYPAQRMGKYVLVDGGIVNPVPGNVVASMGADRIIAVNLMGSRRLPPIEAAAGAPRGAPPPALQVLRRSIDIMQRNITAHTARASTVLIEPEFTSSSSWRGLRSASEGSRYIETGEAAAEAALPRLAAVLPWLNGS
jgi:NTE family protein